MVDLGPVTQLHYLPAWRRLSVSGLLGQTQIDSIHHELRVEQRSSPRLTTHLAVSTGSIDRIMTSDYTTRNLVAGLAWQGQWIQLNMHGGPEEIENENGAITKTTGSAIAVNMTTSLGQILISSQRQLTDETSGIVGALGESDVTSLSSSPDSSGDRLQRIQSSSLGWTTPVGERLGFNVIGTREQRRDLEDSRQEDTRSVDMILSYQVTPGTTIELLTRKTRGEETGQAATERQSTRLTMTSRRSTRLSLQLTVQNDEQTVRGGLSDSNSIRLGVEYCLMHCRR